MRVVLTAMAAVGVAISMLAGVVGVAAVTEEPAGATATAGAGLLRSDGRFMRDQYNRAVVLHGLFAVWKTATWAPTTDPTDPASFTTADAKAIHDLGFDVVRLAYFWEGLEPQPGQISGHYLAQIASVEHKLAINGVHVVLDSHQDMYSSVFSGDGFPAWAVHNDGITLTTNNGFPLNYFSSAVERTFTNFWADDQGVLEAYDHQLAVVANRFASDPMVIGYDLMNEPFSGENQTDCSSATGCPGWDTTVLSPDEAAMAKAVRAASPGKVVFYEPQIFANWGTPNGIVADPTTGPNGFSFHDQCQARAYYQVTHDRPGAIALEAKICPAQNATVMANALAASANGAGLPLMTEVAAATDDDYAGLECVLEQADQNMIGWTYGLSWRSGELRHLDPTKQAVLQRAYPKAVAGNPTSYSFDPRTGTFSLAYQTATDIHGDTEIYLPTAQQYPNGYQVALSGGRVVSKPGTTMLQVHNNGGVHPVTVTVTPANGPVAVTRPDLPACAS